MATYKVTVEFSGSKTYEVTADSPEEIQMIFDKYSSLDHYDNAVDDSVSEDIVQIEKIKD